jgi:energy-coupling factor transporter ATP-binding protein EcfA2
MVVVIAPGAAAAAAVEVTELRYHYADGTEAVKGVSFAIAAGECAAIIGPNGAGKSSVLLHLNGLLPDSADGSGTVSIDGMVVSRKTAMEVRRRVGLLFQDPDDQLFCPTVYEDVAFGPQQFGLAGDALAARVGEALAHVGLAGFEKRSPHRLSGGEKRRVCLAGVLACEPGVLVLDEPTAGLDPRGRREFKALIRDLPVTRILATHDLEAVVELCSHTIILDEGRVVADGNTIELLGDEALMLAHGLERPHVLPRRQDDLERAWRSR